jgi:ribosomal protein S18 acetylase RimI-like enzyme
MMVEIRSLKIDDSDAMERQSVLMLLQNNGWSHRIQSLKQFESLVAASQCNFIAIKDDQIVGYVRAITDGLSNGYVSMLVVAAEQRGQGIGSALVHSLIDSAPQATWVLRAGREGAKEFFEKVGFQVSEVAMERNRQ